MRIAAVQFDISWENKEDNFAKVTELLENIDADLIVLPELFATGYTMNTVHEEEFGGQTNSFLSQLARQKQTHVLGTLIEKTTGKPKNTALLYDAAGNRVLHYSKIHLFTFAHEDEHYQKGTGIPTYKLGEHTVAVVICYDLRFPELFRKLAQQGVTCVLVVANWPQERIEHWDTLLRARAIENQMYVVGVNRIGKSPDAQYNGHSKIIDPFGVVVAHAQGKGVITAEAAISTVNAIREKYPFLRDSQL